MMLKPLLPRMIPIIISAIEVGINEIFNRLSSIGVQKATNATNKNEIFNLKPPINLGC